MRNLWLTYHAEGGIKIRVNPPNPGHPRSHHVALVFKHKFMLHTHIDHLVITAPTLPAGIAYAEETLGVPLQPGGTHLRMGTHNALLKLGESCYLEVIAINPELPVPNCARWFELDGLGRYGQPRLRHWVARTNDIQSAQSLQKGWFGAIESMSRSHLNWLISIPPDGSLPLSGVCPTLIQWQSEPHPASMLSDVGCSLIRLEGYHPKAEKLQEVLEKINFEGAFQVHPIASSERPYLVAHLQTPTGICILDSR